MSRDESDAKIESRLSTSERADGDYYVLRLYVAGQAPASTRALANLKEICEQRLSGRYSLEVIDLHQQPERARLDQVIAVPTLIKELPEPLRRVIGDLSNTERVLNGIGLDRR